MIKLSSYAIGLSAVLSNSAVQAQQLANNRLSVAGGNPEEINRQQFRRRGTTTNDADIDASNVAAYDDQRTLQDLDLSLPTAVISAAEGLPPSSSSSSSSSSSFPSAKSAKTKSSKGAGKESSPSSSFPSAKSAKTKSSKGAGEESSPSSSFPSAKSNKGSGKAEKSSKTKSGKADGMLPSAALNGHPELIGPSAVVPLVADCLQSKGGTGYPCGFFQSTTALFLDREDDPRIQGRVTLVYNNNVSPGGTAFIGCDGGICEYADSQGINDNRFFYGKAAKGGKGSKGSSGKGSSKGDDDDQIGSVETFGDDYYYYDDYYYDDDNNDVGVAGKSDKSGGRAQKYMYCCYEQPQFIEGLTSVSRGGRSNVVL